jgi:hypothetical protein
LRITEHGIKVDHAVECAGSADPVIHLLPFHLVFG